MFTYSPPVVAVRFGHLYKDKADQQTIEGLVWKAVLSQYPLQLVAMDPQRLGSPTAACDLHFRELCLKQKHDLLGCETPAHLVSISLQYCCTIWLLNGC